MRHHLIIVVLTALGCGGDGPKVCAVPLGGAPVRGASDALVTIVEFADFECPYCKAVVPTLDEMLTRYPADVRLAFKHFPLSFHERAFAAALAAECAHAQGSFWTLHDALYEHQPSFSDAELESYAAAAGADLDVWRLCLAAPEAASRINADVAQGEAAGVNGTPTLFVNGEPVDDAVPADVLAGLVDDARDTARASGLSGPDYYDSLDCE